MRIHARRRCGKIVVLVALCLIWLVGVAAIAVDGGLLQDEHQRAQSAADAAALAGAIDLYDNYFSHQGTDPSNTAHNCALANAAADGYTNDGVRSVVTVNIPPLSGPYAGQASYVEVIIQYNQPRGFSNIFGSGDLPVKARAVARGYWSQLKDGILVLDPTGSGSLTAAGNGAMTLIGTAAGSTTPVIVDSNSPTAVVANGGGALTAPVFDITGFPGTSTTGGGSIVGTVNSGQPPTPDPLGYLPEPDPSTMTVQSNKGLQISGKKSVTLDPGVYIGGINVVGQGSVTLNPGIYYMQGGGFSFAGSGTLTGTGVMIYNAPQSKSDVVSLAGTGTVNPTPPTSGVYQGMTIFQDRTSTVPVSVTGNGNMSITGTFYAAAALLTITGNGTVNLTGSQLVSYDLTLAGNGNLTIDYTAAPHPRTRVLTLVE